MKLKYYLRGLGIGVVVTAIIMSITNKPQELTDAEIKMRAAKLGMVEESVLADLQAEESNMDAVEEMLNEYTEDSDEVKPEETNGEQTAEEAEAVNTEDESVAETEETSEETIVETEVAEETTEETAEETDSTTDIISPEAETEDTTEEVVESENTSSGNVEITDEVVENFTIIKIERGNGSEVVSRRLYEAGLVESSVEFNQFLVKNGYDRRLSVGDHEIPAGATYDEMARILCGMR